MLFFFFNISVHCTNCNINITCLNCTTQIENNPVITNEKITTISDVQATTENHKISITTIAGLILSTKATNAMTDYPPKTMNIPSNNPQMQPVMPEESLVKSSTTLSSAKATNEPTDEKTLTTLPNEMA